LICFELVFLLSFDFCRKQQQQQHKTLVVDVFGDCKPLPGIRSASSLLSGTIWNKKAGILIRYFRRNSCCALIFWLIVRNRKWKRSYIE
jgi:hypothetical protein